METVIELVNGDPVPATFSAAEMAGRLAALRAHMDAADLEVALFTSYHNINYYADFLYCAFGRPYGLVVGPDEAVLIAANIDGGQPGRRFRGPCLIYTDWRRDAFYEAVRQAVGGARRIGIEFDHVSLRARTNLAAALPGRSFEDLAEATMRLRMIKSAEEIALIGEGARIADLGGAACRAAIGEGVPEFTVSQAGTDAMVRAIATRFPAAELRDTWTWFQSAINTDGAHHPVTGRRIEKGDILSLNCFPMIAGYYTALERTLFFDHASDEHLRLWQINCAVHRRGLELIRPGAVCREIAAELNAIYAEHDLLKYRTFGYGHSFGVLSHYYGREAGLELREDVETVLAPGMVVSMEPMIMLPEGLPGAGGYREHDILVLEAGGARNITGFPFGPEHNIVAAE